LNESIDLGLHLILGICGSPRKQATEYVLRKALDMLEKQGIETSFFSVRNKDIGFCRHCDHCLRHKECLIKDDMYELYPLIKEANGMVFATPVYNGGVSAQIKAVMDRCRALLASDSDVLQGKAGMAIAVGGDRIGGQELALQQIITFFVLNRMIPLGGGAFGANLGATFWSKDTLKGVEGDTEGFRTLRKAVKSFTKYIDTLKLTPEQGKRSISD
jgi:multimeric flavodoxin WrbA